MGRTLLSRAPDRIGPFALGDFCARLLFAALALAGCGDAPRPATAPIRIALADDLEVALREGRVERVVSADGATPVVRQSLDSRLSYHFALPPGAEIRGEADLRMGAGAGPVGVRVDLVDEDGSHRRLLDRTLRVAEPGALRLRADLSREADRMVRLDFSFRGNEGTRGTAQLDWRELRIDGARRTPAAWQADRDRHNVLLFLMDSLRADHTSPYGADPGATPRLAGLAAEGVTFENARSSSSWTRPSVATLLTSVQPDTHAVLAFEDGLAASLPYLPEILQHSGYRTLAVVNNAMIDSRFGFARGFDRMAQLYPMRSPEARIARRDPEALAEFVWSGHVAPWLRAGPHEPFFVYLHEVDPHSPYEPPEPYASLHDFGYDGDVSSSIRGLGALRRDPDSVDPRDIRQLRSLYRGEVAFMDRYLGWLLDRLESLDLSRSTLVIVASDHGEEFWEHRSVGHGHSVYEELLRVPLVMRLAGVLPAGRRVQADVGLIDLAPTLLDLLGIAIPPGMRGESLLPYVAAAVSERPARASFARAVGPWESVSYGHWKLIRSDDPDGPGPALFDLEADPLEQRDLARERPVVVGTLAQMLRRNRRMATRDRVEAIRVAPGDLDPDAIENLRALGYVE